MEDYWRWIKPIMSNGEWHLTLDGIHVACGQVEFTEGLRHHFRPMQVNPPPDACEACLDEWNGDQVK